MNYANIFNAHNSAEKPTILSKAETDEVYQVMEFVAKDINFKATEKARRIIDRAINVNIDHKKALYVCGPPGIGKSMAFKALSRLERSKGHPYPLWNINIREFQELYKAQGADYFLEVVYYPRVVLHNFGHHDENFNDYGTKRDIVSDLLDQRYDRFQNNKTNRTYITSNFDKSYVKSLGPVMARRIIEMMNYVEL